MSTQTFAPTIERPAARRPVGTKGWHDDPVGHHNLRYHDGNGWTDHVTHFGPVPCHGCR